MRADVLYPVPSNNGDTREQHRATQKNDLCLWYSNGYSGRHTPRKQWRDICRSGSGERS